MQPRVRTCFCDFSLNWIIRRSHLRADVRDSQASTLPYPTLTLTLEAIHCSLPQPPTCRCA